MRASLIAALALAALASCAEPGDDGAAGGETAGTTATADAPGPPPGAATLPGNLLDGSIRPEDAVAAYLERIERVDRSGPTLQSVLAVNPDAIADARALAAARAGGAAPGPLYGLPILVKDNIETQELPTTAGSRALLANDTGRDAPAIARLRAAGAIILGKTNLSEWANFRSTGSISGWSAVGGLTRNPHDLSRNACGSSSGSGAAVAAGLAWAALGTETNGSVTCPAALNGIVGFKPTVGLVSRRHVVPISPSQDTIGPMTTSVRDAAMLLSVMAGTDEMDPATAEADARKVDYVAALRRARLEGLRLGVLRWAQSGDAREQAVFEEALARAEEGGAVLVDIEAWGGERPGEASFTVLKAEFKDSLNAYLADAAPAVNARTLDDLIAFNEADPRELALFDQDIFEESQEMPGMNDEAYREALATVRRTTRDEGIDRLLSENDVDLLVAPSFGVAFTIDPVRGDVIGSRAGAGWVAAIAGYPHLTIPMGDVKGLPLGLSVMGGQWQDAEVLKAGHALEAVLPPRLEPGYRESAFTDPAIAAAMRSEN